MSKEVDENEVVRLYVEEDKTLRHTGEIVGIDHHRVKRILVKHGVKIEKKKRSKPVTEEHKKKLSESLKGRSSWLKGKNLPKEIIYKQIKTKLRSDIDFSVYGDYEKLKVLMKLLRKHREYIGYNDETRKVFLDHFYYDENFNAIYQLWLESDYNKWMYPSFDHKIPISKCGEWELNNYQFLTWFENRMKVDMNVEEWEQCKKLGNVQSDLFIENIFADRSEKSE
ncbi:HNH endonuclease signature motif containing protein [Oceanobacillus sp. Castelsardo]|uniref:HNH endonuclease signature motif containing protein n=1 Tax=Oceanobacillus sp. Castelsardo TaxID=1851204 RepID=UPI0008398585|nr:HNH endonuclease signature motif containing protein [Oceanobacillus sp. Castelsardo]